DFGDPAGALRIATGNINYQLKESDYVPNAAASSNIKIRFGDGGDWADTAEKMYFPTEPRVAVPALGHLILGPVNAYYVIVEAGTGKILWRKNLTNDQTQSATYNVWSATNNLGKAMDSPAPGNPVPGTPDPTTVPPFQAALGTRANVTLIGNEGPL